MKQAMYLRIWKWDAVSTYLLHYLGRNGTRHTCVSVGLHPLALASNLGCLVSLAFLVLLVANLLAMAPQPVFDGLQPKGEDPQL